ncbi:Rho guanine nucleotide exchange factor 5 [Acipenser ruthenus]|uniref:Rho guanine nucleotide exchange factor 5 n=1 Tax=Acipenser ruthenus TaxID=7906 RepID=A0A444U806_ACIRT|nr:Rho guanine nucleotide exchange factor 5 [Acipenser ruthenus]
MGGERKWRGERVEERRTIEEKGGGAKKEGRMEKVERRERVEERKGEGREGRGEGARREGRWEEHLVIEMNIVKNTTPGSEEEDQSTRALRALDKIFPLVSQSCRLVKEGELSHLLELLGKISEREVYLHLFNNYLLLSHPKESEKLQWLSALSPTPEIDFLACQDLPQVLCLRSYVQHQPDELNLEKADVIVVHQQTSDGWVEGTRLADCKRGWFPHSHVELISSQRTRLRNLKERQRIACATCKQPKDTA